MAHSDGTTMELPALGTTIAGKYQLQTVIGEGGMGRVYAAHHELMDKRVALKLMRPTLGPDLELRKARFLREAQAAARIRHPNVVEVYDVGVDGALLFMVMEYLEGASFGDIMVRDDVTQLQKLALLIEAMHGIAAAHEQGIVHRDIKPDNIFITRTAMPRANARTVAKVLDFGISKLRDEAMHTHVTQSGMAMGTPVYMSSEQMHSARDVDARTDVYSMGVVLYETLAGELPFDGDTPAAIIVKMHTERPRSLRAVRPELPAALEHVVLKAMALRSEQRYESMQALIEALEAVLPELQREPMLGAMRRPLTTAEVIAPTMPTPIASVGVRAAKARVRWTRWAGAGVVATLVGMAGAHYAAPARPAANERAVPAALPQAPAALVPSSEPLHVVTPAPVPVQVEPPDAGAATPRVRTRRHRDRSAPVTTKVDEPALAPAEVPVTPPAPAVTPVERARAARGKRSGELRQDDL